MPVYEYRCRKCGGEFEVLAPTMKDPDDLACAHCGGRDVERQMSVFAARQAEVERGGCGSCPGAAPSGSCCPWRAGNEDCCG